MKIADHKVVTMTYTLREDNAEGTIVQQVDKDRPFVHLFGNGTLLPAFEENLAGKEPGDTFGFTLTPEEGYGVRSEEAVIDLEKSIFVIDGKFDEEMVAVGKSLTMQDQNGNPLQGLILEVGENSVKMDFNHPLADQQLYFSGEIMDVRDASAEELDHGHVHGPHGHHH